MGIVFHRLVSKDVRDVMRYFADVAGDKLAEEFYAELMSLLATAADQPTRFHFDSSGLRRANLKRFPFHFLYRARRDAIYVLVVRHHRRRPGFGLQRSWQ